MQWLTNISVRRAVFASVLMLVVIVLGILGYGNLGVDFFPNMDIPVVTVVTRLDGAAPEEVETQISEKIEGAVNTISGLDELYSQSSEGVSVIIVALDMDKNPDVATQEVRDRIQRILPELPKGIDPPQVNKLDPDAVPVLYVAIRSNQSLRETTEVADKRIRRAIENTPGVGQVMLLGGRMRQINVLLDAAALQAHGLTALDVQWAIGAQNLSMPGGTVQTGPRDLTLRVYGRVKTTEELARIVLRQNGDHPIRVEDVAKVEDGEREVETAASIDGQPTVLLMVQKQSGGNTVAVSDAVRERLDRIEKALPAGYSIEVVRDISETIRTQVKAVEEHLILGALFAALVVLVFLGNVRSTLIAERIARETRRLPGVLHTVTTIGDTDLRATNLAHIYVKLTDPEERTESLEKLIERTRREVVSKQPKELRIDVSEVDLISSGTSEKKVQYVIDGPDLHQLGRFATNIVGRLKQAPGAVDVDSDLTVGKPEIRIDLLRDKAADLGVQVADVAIAVRLLVGGVKVSTYEEGGEDYDVLLRAALSDRSQTEHIGLLWVPSARLGNVPLRNLVHLSSATGPSQINRLNRRRQVTIGANVRPGFGESDVQAQLEKAIQDEHLPAAYQALPAGQTREAERTAKGFLVAFALSFIFMYLILAAQFESWLHPFTIMLCLPLTVPFALLSLLMFGQSLNIMSALGLFVLFGVVKKNAILQVDHTNSLRAEGLPRDEAILLANRHRLRPILMTTFAFVAGMLPLVMAKGIGAGFNHAIASIVMGGQTLSLLLTLLATPVFYSLIDDASSWFLRRLSRGAPVDRGRAQIDVPARNTAGLLPSTTAVAQPDPG